MPQDQITNQPQCNVKYPNQIAILMSFLFLHGLLVSNFKPGAIYFENVKFRWPQKFQSFESKSESNND